MPQAHLASLRNSREFLHDLHAEIASGSDRFTDEIFRAMPLWHLLGLIPLVLVDHAPALHCGPRFDHISPALEIFIDADIQKLGRVGIAAP